jgi:hypothetical protein
MILMLGICFAVMLLGVQKDFGQQCLFSCAGNRSTAMIKFADFSGRSLARVQVRVLLKNPKSPEVGEDDTFSYNADFSNPLYRIRINNIQMKETTEENVKTNEQVGG